MIKRFLSLLFGNWGLLISSILTAVAAGFLFPVFMTQVGGGISIVSTFVAILLGIFAVGFYASSFLTAFTLSIRSGIEHRWILFSISLLVIIADVIVLIINLV